MVAAVDEQHPPDAKLDPPRTREPEPQREPRIGEQRQRVPVSHRLAEPGDPIPVLEERRDGDSEQRPGERGRDDDRDGRGDPARSGREGAAEQPECEERDVDEPTGEPVPRAVAGDRPDDRGARPGGQGDAPATTTTPGPSSRRSGR